MHGYDRLCERTVNVSPFNINQIMLLYHVVARKNPRNKGQVVYSGQLGVPLPVGLDTISEQIAQECTLTSADIIAVLDLLERKIAQSLLDGKSVRFGKLGSFHLNINAKTVKNPLDWDSKKIQRLKICYLRSSKMYHELQLHNLSFVNRRKL